MKTDPQTQDVIARVIEDVRLKEYEGVPYRIDIDAYGEECVVCSCGERLTYAEAALDVAYCLGDESQDPERLEDTLRVSEWQDQTLVKRAKESYFQ